MRLMALESVLTHCCGYYLVDLSDEGWTEAKVDNRWWTDGERLARRYMQAEDGTLVEREGGPRFVG
jgi:hypothetical protein